MQDGQDQKFRTVELAECCSCRPRNWLCSPQTAQTERYMHGRRNYRLAANSSPWFVERSHKGMKYTVFSKDRNQMSPAKADRDLYTLLNTRALQRVDSSLAEQVPDWVTLYSEDLESPVAAEPALLLENQGDAAAAAGAM